MSHICGTWTGQALTLPGDSRRSAIARLIAGDGLRLDPGDATGGAGGAAPVDRERHGGVERAVLITAAHRYATLAERLKAPARPLEPGAVGENLCVDGPLDERRARIGDRWRIGGAVLEVCQPRQPCWKLDAWLGEGACRAVLESDTGGWFCRVLVAGEIRVGDRLDCESSDDSAPSVAEVMALHRSHRPAVDALRALAGRPALAAVWRERFTRRADWLESNGHRADPNPGAPT